MNWVVMNWVVILLLVNSVIGNRVKFNQGLDSQVCEGIYSKHDWGGSFKPHIAMKLLGFGKDKFDAKKDIKSQSHEEDIKLSYIIFEYKDLKSIGHFFEDGNVKYICDDDAIGLEICEQKNKGKFIINNNHTNNTILTNVLNHLGQADIHYSINETGYYCVSTYIESDSTKYYGWINFQNAFGQLSASEIPKLPAYGILTLLYGVCIALFGWQFFKKRKENQILPLQRYLLAMLGLLTFDTLVVWSYYDLLNRSNNQSSGFNIFYMIFLSILNACKLTFSFFLLLCIALGYGVVVIKLDKKIMLKCKILAGIHFITSLIYLIFSYYNASQASINSSSNLDDDSINELTTLLPLIPITITLTIYYAMILTSIRQTVTNLNKQRQIIKLKLYENLFRLIFFSFFLIFIGIFLASFRFLSMSSTQVIEQSWKYTFFIFEFTPLVIYFVIFMGIAWLWRPTETSYMLAVSQQVSTDENIGTNPGTEFELDDISLMSHDDEETTAGGNNNTDGRHDSFELDEPPTYDSVPKDTKDLDQFNHEEENGQLSVGESNTLFELGDESDNEHHQDDRLK